MSSAPSDPRHFDTATRARLEAILAAALPPGDRFPPPDGTSVGRLEVMLAGYGPGAVPAFTRLLFAFDHAARLHTGGRTFTALQPEEGAALLQHHLDGNRAQHALAKALLSPILVAHFDNPDVYRELGAPRREVTVETARWESQIVPGTDLEAEIECDVVVVGTGAGGAVVAKELAERGLAVLMLEEGEYWRRDAFTGPSWAAFQHFYRDKGAVFAFGNTVIPVFCGRLVGGSTAINSGTCFRTPDAVLSRWAERTGIPDLRPDAMARHLDRVEHVLEVTEAEPRWIGGVGRVIARGCDRLGYSHGPLRRNAPACDGAGTCVFGCPAGAKRSTDVSYVPLALGQGAMVATGTRAERVLVEGGTAVGVEASLTDGRRVRVRARATVLACGTVLTPVFLQRQGLGKWLPQLGRNLTIHPAGGATGVFDEEIRGYGAIPQGYSIDQFHDSGIMFEGASLPIDLSAVVFDAVGERLVHLMERLENAATFGYMIVDRPLGRVRATPSGRPAITYRVGRRETRLLREAVTTLTRVLLAAGASEVHTGVHGHRVIRDPAGLARLADAHLRARDFKLTAYHPLGTARMGATPAQGVVNGDGEVFGVPGLLVADGSVVPGSPTVNPQVTIMAFATRIAERLAIRLDSPPPAAWRDSDTVGVLGSAHVGG
ncbi:MAG: GMC family oxidoreductase [Acidimicrobiia bacterium]|nr:GMC family oxidoreductase [Acidimicrobiia bacterium]